MPSSKLAAAWGLAALSLCACGTAVKPPQGHGKIDDPRTYRPNRMACLKQHHLPAVAVGLTGIQIGSPPGGPVVHYDPSSGAAQGQQIEGVGTAQGAEVIGSALLYPNGAGDSELKTIELCLSKGVSG